MTNPATYSECLALIRAESNKATKIQLVSLLPSLRTGNPLYEEGLFTIASEEDSDVRELLTDEIYQFLINLSVEERDVFGYVKSGYIEDDPGVIDGIFSSYIGVYIDQEGEYSGEYP